MMPGLTVHHLQVGQGERIPWLLEELGVPYELKLYQRSPLFSPPELKTQHPMGASPVIEDATFNPENPLVLAESGAIAEYIIHKHGNGRLALTPSHPDYANYLYWFHFANGNLQPTIGRRMTARFMAQSLEDPRFISTDQRLHTALKLLDDQTAKNTWLAGDQFTAADVMSVFCLTTMRKFEPIDLSDYPGILEWLKRCTARPAYRAAMKKGDPDLNVEELISAKPPALFEGFVKAAEQAKIAEQVK
ncbi:glutathione S-transferase [Lindgomyces ingoldianus]|uniref:Glutathione S-transferase n=1 Tax=Lindgomyces ingoldianus TaxID=673940 RepID=A0ACB6QIQ9_9PLEO|nr:glutathione S-transferase [Lindgomyces ingoldianus]KAF2466026.1 glutathione S-transferase [Lindgomyces ingoldianus]